MMNELLPSGSILGAFLLASFILAVTPGPSVLYIVARSSLQGRQYGLASVGGVALGNFGNAMGASLGLAALFAVSAVAFTVVKWAGAAYLVYLGVKTIRDARKTARMNVTPAPKSAMRIFRDGFFVALLNPKTTIFFAAFLPQFMTATGNIAAQSMALGAVFVAMAAATDTAYALAASGASRFLSGSGKFGKLGSYGVGGIFIGLGLVALIADRPNVHQRSTF
ncbi:LysE family translocator [Sedimentitalea sp. XS_ASV28]|uniref:LysE family translocator n=1 Tax=Sedimentitalea sp. XS_ASV28 TaxID=3241296 RepID=UPI003513BEDC